MTKLELLKKEMEEKFHDENYVLFENTDDNYIYIHAKDRDFGGRFVRLISNLKVPFFINCADAEIAINKERLNDTCQVGHVINLS